jgi:hypothetical protein
VQELQIVAAERTKVTIPSLIQEAEEVRCLAVANRQLSAANTSIVTKAKLSGLWVDRSEVGEVDLSRMSQEELRKMGVLNDEPRRPESPTIYSRPTGIARPRRSLRRR